MSLEQVVLVLSCQGVVIGRLDVRLLDGFDLVWKRHLYTVLLRVPTMWVAGDTTIVFGLLV